MRWPFNPKKTSQDSMIKKLNEYFSNIRRPFNFEKSPFQDPIINELKEYKNQLESSKDKPGRYWTIVVDAAHLLRKENGLDEYKKFFYPKMVEFLEISLREAPQWLREEIINEINFYNSELSKIRDQGQKPKI